MLRQPAPFRARKDVCRRLTDIGLAPRQSENTKGFLARKIPPRGTRCKRMGMVVPTGAMLLQSCKLVGARAALTRARKREDKCGN